MDRRDFLKTSMLGAAVAMTGSGNLLSASNENSRKPVRLEAN